jgi:hypothetical protein
VEGKQGRGEGEGVDEYGGEDYLPPLIHITNPTLTKVSIHVAGLLLLLHDGTCQIVNITSATVHLSSALALYRLVNEVFQLSLIQGRPQRPSDMLVNTDPVIRD